MNKYHWIVIVVWIGLAFFLMGFAWEMGLGKLRSPGPGLMPFILGGFLSLMSFCLLLVDLYRKGVREEPLEERTGVNFRKLVIVVGSLVLYGLLLERLGFGRLQCNMKLLSDRR